MAGITPIDEMLRIAQVGAATGGAVMPAAATPRMTGAEFLTTIANSKSETVFDKLTGDFAARQPSSLGAAKRIALPVSAKHLSRHDPGYTGPSNPEMAESAISLREHAQA